MFDVLAWSFSVALAGTLKVIPPENAPAMNYEKCHVYQEEAYVGSLSEGGGVKLTHLISGGQGNRYRLTLYCEGYLPQVLDLASKGTKTNVVRLRRPNILFLLVDDLSDYTGFMKNKPRPGDGHPNVLTPNIDQLAKTGVKFMNAHVQAPLCGPSRVSLLTGLYPSTTGVYLHPKTKEYTAAKKRNGVLDLVEYFNQNGYLTIGQGKINHSQIPLAFKLGSSKTDWGPRPKTPLSYDEHNLRYTDGRTVSLKGRTMSDWGYWEAYNPEKGSLSKEDMPDYQTASFAMSYLQKKQPKPFFMTIGLVKPHNPWINPWEYNDRFPLDKLSFPVVDPDDYKDIPVPIVRLNTRSEMPPYNWMTESGHKKERVLGILQSYLASVAFTDDQVGRILKALESGPHRDDTIVILASDNGYHMGEKLVWQKQSLWRESTRVPFVIRIPNLPNTHDIQKPVGLIDIYPTLLTLTGLPSYNKNEGIDLTPILVQADASLERVAIRTTWGRGNHAITSERYKYVRIWKEGRKYEELYDHYTDPHEHNNLTDKEFFDIKQRLSALLPDRSDESVWHTERESVFEP